MGKKFLGLLNKLLAFVLTLLGVQSCDPGADEYGCPTADYIFHGRVTDEKGNALSGVKIYTMRNYEEYKNFLKTMEEYDEPHDEYHDNYIYKNFFDSISVTRADGSYSLLLQDGCGWHNAEGLHFASKDGMQADTLLKDIELAPLKGGKEWNKGVSDNTLDITLKKK
ncbi:MAG: radical SAM-associated putative lipoprotein [Paludibacteraceae bacterium]|nr:radical SAM-associated putative lipoprotein [Paludibacteraceae bacterium]